MRRSNKKRLIPLALALVLALVGAALAVPVITVNIQQIGAGSNPVLSPVDVANISWTLASNPDYVSGAVIVFDQTIPAGSQVYLKIYNSTGSIIALGVNATTTSTNTVTISFTSDVDITKMETAAVVVKGPSP